MARTNSQILFGKASDLPEPPPERGQTFTLTPPPRNEDRANGQGTTGKDAGSPSAGGGWLDFDNLPDEDQAYERDTGRNFDCGGRTR
ncbi:MAG TPA: hypothetical protein VMU78_02125 [Methylocella sp.]|nr:hypothetical protein [Methylocella sp.]